VLLLLLPAQDGAAAVRGGADAAEVGQREQLRPGGAARSAPERPAPPAPAPPRTAFKADRAQGTHACSGAPP